ncbi:hypothetical protein ACI8AC_12370 [Geodermatophilus sp. SYSU D00758]
MTPDPGTAPIPGLRRLTTPRAAAWAGVLFAALFGTGLVLVRLWIPADPFADPDWVAAGSGRLRWAMTLVPLAGIAFLWFLGVVRDRLGDLEDRFLASVFLGSGLLFLAMTSASTAIAGGILISASDGGQVYDPAVLRFSRATMLQISDVYALRMAAAFMISLATIWLRTGLMPRWLVVLTYALALVLLVVTTLSLWTTLVFPAWALLVSVLFLVRSSTARPGAPTPV